MNGLQKLLAHVRGVFVIYEKQEVPNSIYSFLRSEMWFNRKYLYIVKIKNILKNVLTTHPEADIL